MKIAFVTSSLHGGGITSYAHEFANCFAELHDINIIVGDDSLCSFDRQKVTVYNCESSDISVINAKRLLYLINDLIKPDVVINSNSELLTLVLPFISNNIRYITVSHSLRYNEADIAGYNSQYADNLIALSTYNKEYLSKQYHILDSNKIKVVYNFVDEYKSAFELLEEKKKNWPLRIVYAGGTSSVKNPVLVFDILQKLLDTNRDFKFYFMGDKTPTMQRIQLYKSIEELIKPDDRVIFTGRVPRQKSEELIGSANILFIPSKREGCPIVMLEAMRAGCIIITSDYKNACREMIIDGKSGFIIPHNKKEVFFERILDIIDHHNTYLSFYDECYQEFVNRFSFQHWKEQMVAIISNNNMMHSSRIITFSEQKYRKMCKSFIRRKKYNAIHMFFHEKLGTVIYFYIKYIKTKFKNI